MNFSFCFTKLLKSAGRLGGEERPERVLKFRKFNVPVRKKLMVSSSEECFDEDYFHEMVDSSIYIFVTRSQPSLKNICDIDFHFCRKDVSKFVLNTYRARV